MPRRKEPAHLPSRERGGRAAPRLLHARARELQLRVRVERGRARRRGEVGHEDEAEERDGHGDEAVDDEEPCAGCQSGERRGGRMRVGMGGLTFPPGESVCAVQPVVHALLCMRCEASARASARECTDRLQEPADHRPYRRSCLRLIVNKGAHGLPDELRTWMIHARFASSSPLYQLPMTYCERGFRMSAVRACGMGGMHALGWQGRTSTRRGRLGSARRRA